MFGRIARVSRRATKTKVQVAIKTKSSRAAKAAKALANKPSPKRPAAARTSAAKAKYHPTSPERVNKLIQRLVATYPDPRCALHHKNAWELLVATILSAQCTDVRVNMVTPALFAKYPGPEAMARATPEQIEPDIRSTGFFRNKARSLVGAAKKVMQDFAGQVPKEMDALLTIPGVARKTANVVLGSWFEIAEGVVVDTHVHRISRRLELTREDSPPRIEQDLMRVVPREKWIDFSHLVILHGRALCIARKPRCADCPLEDLCHAADKTWSSVELHRSAKP